MPGAFDVNVGTLTQVWTLTEYSAGLCPKVGTTFYNENLSVGPVGWYIFLRNSQSTAIAASLVCSALLGDRVWTSSSITSTTAPTPSCQLAATTNNLPFGGVRVVGATSVAQNEFGWFQISGAATLTADAAGTAPETYVTTSNATAGRVESLAGTAAVDAVNAFGIARTTTTSATCLVDLTNSVWAQR